MNKKLQFFSQFLVAIVLTSLVISACTPNVEELISQGDVKGLIRALENNDTDREKRQQIVEKLGELGDEHAVWTLIRTLKDDYAPVRNAAVDALINIGAPAVEPLLEAMIEALDEDDIDLSSDIMHVLGNIGDSRAVVPLIGMLKEDNDAVRKNAALALGKIGDKRATQHLINALRDENKGFRRFAAKSLGDLGDPIAVGPLLDVCRKEINDKYFREDAADALVNIGTPAIEPLIEALHNDDGIVRRYAKEALIKIGEASGTSELEQWILLLKNNDKAVRSIAYDVLINFGASSVEPLIKVLNDDEVDIRILVVALLGDIGDSRALEPLIEILDENDADLQKAAALALGKIGDERAFDTLIAHFGFQVPGNYGWINKGEREIYEPIGRSIVSVLIGEGVAEAAFYDAEISGPHPLIVLETDGLVSAWNDSLPLGWAPSSVSEVELVVVVGKEQLELTGNRIYIFYINGEEVNRFAMNGYRHKVEVQVIEARTGTVLKTTTLYGSHPRFPESLPEIPREKSIGGSDVSFDDFLIWWMGEEMKENS